MIISKFRIPLLCLLILALAAQAAFAQSVQFRVAATENQNLYTGPGYNYSASAGAFAGNTFGVVSTSGSGQWYKLDNGYWMDSRKARRSGSQQAPAVSSSSTAYTNTGANIRSGPSTRYPVIGGARSGAYVTIYSQSGQWYQAYANGVNGWIYGPLLTFSGQAAAPRYVAPTPVPRYVAPTPVPYRPPAQQYSPPPSYSQSCSCNYNRYNCSDFSTQRSAQACMQTCYASVGYDIHWLDNDNDGIACEWNP